MLLKSEYWTVKLRRWMPSARSARITFSFLREPSRQDVPGLRPGALDLEVALDVAAPVLVRPVADDRDQVLRVRALALVLVVGDAHDVRRPEARVRVLLVVVLAARVRLGDAPARLLAVDAGQDEDSVPRLGRVDGRLDVVEVTALEQLQVALLGLPAEQRADALLRVGLAHDEGLPAVPVLRHLAELVVGVVGDPLGVAVGGSGADREQERDGGEQGEHAGRVH